MKKVIAAAVVSVALLSALTACGSSDSKSKTASSAAPADTAGGAKTITVSASNFKFAPNEIRVKKGDKVTIKLENAQGMHGLSAAGLNVDLKKNGDSMTFTADKTGSFDFLCSVNCGAGHNDMKGKIIVE